MLSLTFPEVGRPSVLSLHYEMSQIRLAEKSLYSRAKKALNAAVIV